MRGIKQALIAAFVAAGLTSLGGCTSMFADRESGAAVAWQAWGAGAFDEARVLAEGLIAEGNSVDEARHVLALARHVQGDSAGALDAYEAIEADYRRLRELDEPMLLSVWRAEGPGAARDFAERRGLTRDEVIRERLRLAVERPLEVEIPGLVELRFTEDPLSPYMPGVGALLNGHPTVARLDTGGSFVHLSAEQAETFGVGTVACERTFAALRMGKVCYGVADLELGPVRLLNVPVALHHGVIPSAQVAEAFGVELGPIIGTNVLEQFLTTVDTPGRRLMLSARDDPAAREAHLARLEEGCPDAAAPGCESIEVAFALWLEHLMIATGRVGGQAGVNFFVDSGLVAVTPDDRQAALLASRGKLASWGASASAAGTIVELPGTIGLGAASQRGAAAFAVSDRTWRGFGDWGGVRVDGLVAYGFLKRYVWTIDFDRMVYRLTDGS